MIQYNMFYVNKSFSLTHNKIENWEARKVCCYTCGTPTSMIMHIDTLGLDELDFGEPSSYYFFFWIDNNCIGEFHPPQIFNLINDTYVKHLHCKKCKKPLFEQINDYMVKINNVWFEHA